MNYGLIGEAERKSSPDFCKLHAPYSLGVVKSHILFIGGLQNSWGKCSTNLIPPPTNNYRFLIIQDSLSLAWRHNLYQIIWDQTCILSNTCWHHRIMKLVRPVWSRAFDACLPLYFPFYQVNMTAQPERSVAQLLIWASDVGIKLSVVWLQSNIAWSDDRNHD